MMLVLIELFRPRLSDSRRGFRNLPDYQGCQISKTEEKGNGVESSGKCIAQDSYYTNEIDMRGAKNYSVCIICMYDINKSQVVLKKSVIAIWRFMASLLDNPCFKL